MSVPMKYDAAPVRFVLKHKPRLVTLEDGRMGMKIHPQDAHLFDEAELVGVVYGRCICIQRDACPLGCSEGCDACMAERREARK